jgi:hypothetical protein
MKVILACDGPAGRAMPTRTQLAGQIGVFVGLFVPEEALSAAEQRLDAAIAPYRGKAERFSTDA